MAADTHRSEQIEALSLQVLIEMRKDPTFDQDPHWPERLRSKFTLVLDELAARGLRVVVANRFLHVGAAPRQECDECATHFNPEECQSGCPLCLIIGRDEGAGDAEMVALDRALRQWQSKTDELKHGSER